MKERLAVYMAITEYVTSLRDMYNYDDNTSDNEKVDIIGRYKIVLSAAERNKIHFLFGDEVSAFSQSLHWQAEQLFLRLSNENSIFPQVKEFGMQLMEFDNMIQPYLDFSSYKKL